MSSVANSNSSSPNKNMERAVQKRIAAMRDYRQKNRLEKFPEEVDLDELAPGTSQWVGGFDNERLLRKLATNKDKQDGLLGIQYRHGRFKAVFMGDELGKFSTAVEAAEAYNHASRKRFGDRAVLCDLRAARRYEKQTTG